MQPDQFELELFIYGLHRQASVTMRRDVAEKSAQWYVGKNMIFHSQLVRIISVRLEDDPAYPGERGRVVAICEPVSQLEAVKPRPYAPEMEYK